MNMSLIAFIDTEVDAKSQNILDIGSVKSDGSSFHKNSILEFTVFVNGVEFICGHNILKHDIKYLGKALIDAGVESANIIDTLWLSPLLFPTRPYHALLKDDKLQTEELNNPLNDSIKARDLFYDEVSAFNQADGAIKEILYLLLGRIKEFQAFFRYVNYKVERTDVEALIRLKFRDEICEHVNLTKIINEHPVELAYCLSLVNSFITHKKVHSITPPWVLKNYPEVECIMLALRSKPCVMGCNYCNNALDIYRGLKKFFGFDSYRMQGKRI
jgi:ATP-dependent DNA helicase RecQ